MSALRSFAVGVRACLSRKAAKPHQIPSRFGVFAVIGLALSTGTDSRVHAQSLTDPNLQVATVISATTQPTNAYDRQQKALKDPYGYSPGFEKTDISGGKLGTFDKDAFKKDVDRVFNP